MGISGDLLIVLAGYRGCSVLAFYCSGDRCACADGAGYLRDSGHYSDLANHLHRKSRKSRRLCDLY